MIRYLQTEDDTWAALSCRALWNGAVNANISPPTELASNGEAGAADASYRSSPTTGTPHARRNSSSPPAARPTPSCLARTGTGRRGKKSPSPLDNNFLIDLRSAGHVTVSAAAAACPR